MASLCDAIMDRSVTKASSRSSFSASVSLTWESAFLISPSLATIALFVLSIFSCLASLARSSFSLSSAAFLASTIRSRRIVLSFFRLSRLVSKYASTLTPVPSSRGLRFLIANSFAASIADSILSTTLRDSLILSTSSSERTAVFSSFGVFSAIFLLALSSTVSAFSMAPLAVSIIAITAFVLAASIFSSSIVFAKTASADIRACSYWSFMSL